MIYYDFRRGLSRQKCIGQLISTFSDEAPSYATVKRWYNKFNRSHHALTDEFRKGRPKLVVVHVTYCEIKVTLGISSTSIYKMLSEYLAVKKICFCWISHSLTKQCFRDVSSGMEKIL